MEARQVLAVGAYHPSGAVLREIQALAKLKKELVVWVHDDGGNGCGVRIVVKDDDVREHFKVCPSCGASLEHTRRRLKSS